MSSTESRTFLNDFVATDNSCHSVVRILMDLREGKVPHTCLGEESTFWKFVGEISRL